MAVNWGTLTDPAEQARIMKRVTGTLDFNERQPGFAYGPGTTRETAMERAVQSSLPGAPAVGGGAPLAGGGSVGGSFGSLTSGGRPFPGTAPTPTPFGDFVAPTAANFEHSPDFQYLMDEQRKARENSAAQRGTLLNTGTVKDLQRDAAGIAAGDFGNAFNRATTTYGLNRGTNAQNWGQGMDQFRGNLDAWNTGDSSALNWARFNASQKPAGAGDSTIGPMVTESVGPSAAQTYADYVASLRQQQEPDPLLPRASLPGLFRREYRGAGQ